MVINAKLNVVVTMRVRFRPHVRVKEVCFEIGFKGEERVNNRNVLWERVPKVGGRTDDFRPHGSQAGRWCSELDSRAGSDMKEFGKIQRDKVIKGLLIFCGTEMNCRHE